MILTTENLLKDQIERINNSKDGNDVLEVINDINKETTPDDDYSDYFPWWNGQIK